MQSKAAAEGKTGQLRRRSKLNLIYCMKLPALQRLAAFCGIFLFVADVIPPGKDKPGRPSEPGGCAKKSSHAFIPVSLPAPAAPRA